MVSLSLKLLPSARGLSKRRTAGSLQVCPPSVERLARTALRGVLLSNEIEIACSVPVGPNDTQGSDARSYPPASPVPPAQVVNLGALGSQFRPPSRVKPASSPWAPPSDQRSCCQNPTMLLGFVGLTATDGSTSPFS